MDLVNHLNNVQNYAKSLKDTQIRHPGEFFDYQRVSRPRDMQEYLKRASYNMWVVLSGNRLQVLATQQCLGD